MPRRTGTPTAFVARGARKSSNLENLALGPGAGAKGTSHKIARAASASVLKDATLRRRNRVLSGIKPGRAEDAVRRQKAHPAVRVNLPTQSRATKPQ